MQHGLHEAWTRCKSRGTLIVCIASIGVLIVCRPLIVSIRCIASIPPSDRYHPYNPSQNNLIAYS